MQRNLTTVVHITQCLKMSQKSLLLRVKIHFQGVEITFFQFFDHF